MHIPRRCKLAEVEGPSFQHSWRPGWLYGRPVGTSVSSWFPESSVVEATPRDIKECCVLFLYAFKSILYIICDPDLPTVFPVLSYPQLHVPPFVHFLTLIICACLVFFFLSCHLLCNYFFLLQHLLTAFLGSPFLILSFDVGFLM